MVGTVILGMFIALGITMYTRGLIYTLKPDGAMALKRQKKNLKYGMTTDMLVFGRKVRRLGFMITLVCGGILAYLHAGDDEAPAAAQPAEATADKAGRTPSE